MISPEERKSVMETTLVIETLLRTFNDCTYLSE